MKVTSALTQHPEAAQAVGEIAGQILESSSSQPNILLNFITPAYENDISEINKTLYDLINPFSSFTCISEGIIGINQEVEIGPGISSMALNCDDAIMLDLSFFSTLNLKSETDKQEWTSYSTTWSDALGQTPSFMILIANPFRFDIGSYMQWHEEYFGDVPVIGSLMYGTGPQDQRLFAGENMKLVTAIALLFGQQSVVKPVYSYSFSPVGEPFTVTGAEEAEIISLGNKNPLDYLIRLATTKFSKNQIRLVNNGMLKLGKVINDSKLTFRPDDFIPLDIIGVKQDIGSLIVESTIEIGSTVQFLLDDPVSASNDFADVLGANKAKAAILFPNEFRGKGFFGKPHQDAKTLSTTIAPNAVCGHFSKLPFCYSNRIVQQSKNAISVAVFES